MKDIAEIVLGVSAAVAVIGVLVFVGALVAAVTPAHRNPIAYRWISWHAHHRESRPH